MRASIDYTWRAPITNEEMVDLAVSYGGKPGVGWWLRVKEHSLGWMGARDRTGLLVGFVNSLFAQGEHQGWEEIGIKLP